MNIWNKCRTVKTSCVHGVSWPVETWMLHTQRVRQLTTVQRPLAPAGMFFTYKTKSVAAAATLVSCGHVIEDQQHGLFSIQQRNGRAIGTVGRAYYSLTARTAPGRRKTVVYLCDMQVSRLQFVVGSWLETFGIPDVLFGLSKKYLFYGCSVILVRCGLRTQSIDSFAGITQHAFDIDGEKSILLWLEKSNKRQCFCGISVLQQVCVGVAYHVSC